MKLILYTVFVFLGITAQVSLVNAVPCSSNSDCTATDHVTATCTNSVCVCASGYVAVESGCAAKYPKPMITTNGDEAAEAIDTATVTLRCGGTSGTYAWYQDGSNTAVPLQTSSTITHTMTTANVQFQCTDGSGDLVSEKSDAFTVTYLANGATSSATPTITLQSSKVAATRTFTVTCTGAPFGATTALTDESDTTVTSPITQPADPSTKSVKCTFTAAGITFSNSPQTKSYPTFATEVDSVSITGSGTATVYTVAGAPTLTCTPEPGTAFLPASLTLAYSWTSSVGTSPTTATWDLSTAVEGTYTGATCTITEGANTDVSSALGSLTLDNDYLTAPTVTPTPTSPVVGGTVALACTTTATGVTFSWSKGGTTIERQTDSTIQYTTLVTATHDGSYTCTIAKNGFTATSNAYTLTSATSLTNPTITGGTDVGQYGSLVLTCTTNHAFSGLNYAWTLNGTALTTTTATHTITNAEESSHFGEYICTISFNSMTATSAGVTVNVIAPGVVCTTDADCDGTQASLTGTCDTSSGRCACENGYYRAGSACQSGVSQVAGSVLLVAFAAALSRLF